MTDESKAISDAQGGDIHSFNELVRAYQGPSPTLTALAIKKSQL